MAALMVGCPLLFEDVDYQRAFTIGQICYLDEPVIDGLMDRCLAWVEDEFAIGQGNGNPLAWDIGLVRGWLAGLAMTFPHLAMAGEEHLAELVSRQIAQFY